MSKINSAIIFLDDDMPEYMAGLIRIGSVELFDEKGEIIDDPALTNELVDNKEYQEYESEKMISNIAKRLGISEDEITIE